MYRLRSRDRLTAEIRQLDLALADLLFLSQAVIQPAGDHAGVLMGMSADEKVVEDRHPFEQRDVLEGSGNSEARARRGRQPRDVPVLESDASLLRPIDAAD